MGQVKFEGIRPLGMATQKAAQLTAEMGGNALQTHTGVIQERPILRGFSDACVAVHPNPLLGTGIEPALLAEPEPKSGASANSATRAIKPILPASPSFGQIPSGHYGLMGVAGVKTDSGSPFHRVATRKKLPSKRKNH